MLSCCLPNKKNKNVIINENNNYDIENSTYEVNLSNIEEGNNDYTNIEAIDLEEQEIEIINYLESKKYLYHNNKKERPINNEFKWDELEYNPDKFEYSKRQIMYRNHFLNELTYKNPEVKKELKKYKRIQ